MLDNWFFSLDKLSSTRLAMNQFDKPTNQYQNTSFQLQPNHLSHYIFLPNLHQRLSEGGYSAKS